MAASGEITQGVALWLAARSCEEYISLKKKLSYVLMECRMNNLTGVPRFMKSALSCECSCQP